MNFKPNFNKAKIFTDLECVKNLPVNYGLW